MRKIEKTIYYINEHPNKKLCFEWVRDNWHDLGQPTIDDFVQSLEALARYVNGCLNYALSIVPCRGEYVTIKDYDENLLRELYAKKDDCPLTGCYSDIEVIEGLYDGELSYRVTRCLHNEGEYIYSDKGLEEMCEANDYEFYEDGEFVQ